MNCLMKCLYELCILTHDNFLVVDNGDNFLTSLTYDVCFVYSYIDFKVFLIGRFVSMPSL